MTRKIFLIAGVASLALAAPASGERGGKNRDEAQASGNEQKAQRQQRPERAQRAERPQRAERQQVQRAERPQRAERQQFQRAERPQRMEHQRIQRAERPQRMERQSFQRAERPQRVERQRSQRAERPQRVERQRIERAERQQRVERQRIQRAERPQQVERQRFRQADRSQRIERQRAERPQRVERQRIQNAERSQRIERQRFERQASQRFDRHDFDRDGVRTQNRREVFREQRQAFATRFSADNDRDLARVFRDRPMRQMKFRDDRRFVSVGERIDPVRYSSYVPDFYRTRYYDTRDYYYRYDDDLGYLYRIDRDDNFVRAMIPLFGGYGIGDPWPSTYYSSYVPYGYQSLYYDTPDYYYRNDGYGIYRIDAKTQLISALVALLAGGGYGGGYGGYGGGYGGYGVGQILPSSYGVYNVPLAYRSSYYDRDDAYYRYGDGFIYEVDPYSRQIDARYPIYGAGYDYMIGEPWPVAYPGYNVPYGYQALYADTPQYQYRYANGGIYQVDPTTQVIMALVSLVAGQQQFGIGQPLPVGYSSYNVPLAYRDQYYDTDDAWYRYANGYVYQVDPVNGLIEESYPIYA